MNHKALGVLVLLGLGACAALLACASSPPARLALPAPELLGQPRGSLERSLSAGSAAGEGWIKYSADLRVRYDKAQKARELVARVPEDMGCVEAARWLGFTEAAAPILKAQRCSWPAQSPRHALGPGSSGSLDLKKRMFHAYKH